MDDRRVELLKGEIVVFREPQDGEYGSKSTLTKGTVYPLAFPDVAVSVDLIIESPPDTHPRSRLSVDIDPAIFQVQY